MPLLKLHFLFEGMRRKNWHITKNNDSLLVNTKLHINFFVTFLKPC